jgi:uncharacterized protein YjcR
MTQQRPSLSRRDLAQSMYLDGLSLTEISGFTGASINCLTRWRDQFGWDALCRPQQTPLEIVATQICRLSEKKKTPDERAEFKLLCESYKTLTAALAHEKREQALTDRELRLIGIQEKKELAQAEKERALADKERMLAKKERAIVARMEAETALLKAKGEALLNKVTEQKSGSSKSNSKYQRRVKNDISEITTDMLDALRERLFFGYQLVWYENKHQRHRFILKSRQIGATFYFAFEAFDDAVRTGDNQLFLSASRSQAEVFKSYIITFALTEFDIELKGAEFLQLSNGAELRFLSTNSTTAQSYHGHLYRDELFWILNFDKVNKVSKAMATHKKWRITDISTPSAQSHGAYKIWSGEKYNSTLPEKDRRTLDVSHENLKDGKLFPDGIWRHMVTVYDADNIIKAEIASGKKTEDSDLFDIATLKLEYDDSEFANLFLCKFIDDSQSVFSLATLSQCCVDVEEWSDYKQNEARPFANKAVGIGFDPSRTTDNATIALLEIPTSPTSSFRLLRRMTFNGMNFEYQAGRIRDLVDSHNVIHCGIDITGMGIGVFELVQCFYPLVTPIHYSVENKNRLVLKALDVINNGRFKFLTSDTEVIRAFMMIIRTTSPNGMVVYSSPRNKESGHADAAWAIMHAMSYEPIRPQQQTTITFGN